MPVYRPPIRVRPSLLKKPIGAQQQKPAGREEKKDTPAPVDFSTLVEMFTKMPEILAQIENAKKELLEAHALVLKKTGEVTSTFEAVKKGPPGKPGANAKEVDLDEVVRRAVAMIPKPKDGDPGKDAQPLDEKRIAKRAAKLIELPDMPTPEKIDPQAIVQQVVEMLGKSEIKIPLRTVEGLDGKIAEVHSRIPVEVEQYGKNTWKRGGGDTVAAGTNVTITTDGSGKKVINATGGAGLSVITVTGTIDDSNKTFSAATEPTLLNINGAFYLKTGGSYTWTYVGTTITLNQPVGASGSIFGI